MLPRAACRINSAREMLGAPEPPCSWVFPAHGVPLADETRGPTRDSGSGAGSAPPQGKGMPATKKNISYHPLFIAEQQGKKQIKPSNMKQQEEGGKEIKSFAHQSYIVTLLNQLLPPQSYSRMSEFTSISIGFQRPKN